MWEPSAGNVKVSSGTMCPDAHPVPERFSEGQQHYSEPRRARWWVRTRESIARRSWSLVVMFSAVKTALLVQFSPTDAHRENCGP